MIIPSGGAVYQARSSSSPGCTSGDLQLQERPRCPVPGSIEARSGRGAHSAGERPRPARAPGRTEGAARPGSEGDDPADERPRPPYGIRIGADLVQLAMGCNRCVMDVAWSYRTGGRSMSSPDTGGRLPPAGPLSCLPGSAAHSATAFAGGCAPRRSPSPTDCTGSFGPRFPRAPQGAQRVKKSTSGGWRLSEGSSSGTMHLRVRARGRAVSRLNTRDQGLHLRIGTAGSHDRRCPTHPTRGNR